MDENPGLGRPDCPICEGLGYVVADVPPAHPSFGRAIACTCRSQEREMKRLGKLQKLSQLGALQACTFETFLPTGHGLTEAKQRNLRMA